MSVSFIAELSPVYCCLVLLQISLNIEDIFDSKLVPKRADVDVSPTKNATATNCRSRRPSTYLTYRGGGAGEVRLSTPDSPRQVFGYGSRKCFSRKSPHSPLSILKFQITLDSLTYNIQGVSKKR